jgi:hypothetical protein
MRFPLIILDFEASSLSLNSYPIEVGVAVAHCPDKPLSVWSALIQPERPWVSQGDWDTASAKVHGIAAGELADGCSTREAAVALNRIIGPVGHAWCDGGYYDAMWLEKLYHAAGISPEFALWDMAGLFVLDRPLFRRFSMILAESEPPHRAAADAARLCAALVEANR